MYTIGQKVFHAHRKDREGNYSQHGTIVDIEEGCNGGPVVKWDGQPWRIFMVAKDLAILENGRVCRLDFKDNKIIKLVH